MKVFFNYILPFLFTLFISCDNNNLSNEINNYDQESPIYYKRSISKNNSIYQDEIDIHFNTLKSQKNEQLRNNEILGSWFGNANGNWLTLTISSLNNTMISGFLIQDTIYKTFKGWYSTDDNINYKLGITDEGNDEMNYYDIDLSLENMILKGTSTLVTSNSQNIKSKRISLSKRSLKYNLTNGQYPEFSQRDIEIAEFNNLSRIDLIYICKEILAKHGLIFQNKESRDLFSHTTWYTALNFKVDHLLSDVEKNNLDKIYSFLNR